MLTYLNWAGLAPLTPRAYLQSLWAPELLGNLLLPRWFQRVADLKQRVAQWLGCQPHQVALVPSTSAGLLIASLAIAWQSGDTVLYPQQDFPANVLPWQKLERFGVQAQGVTDWSQPWPASTRLVSLSTVDFTTGIEQPWQAVVQQAHHQGLWTCVDAIQSAGVKPSWCPDIDFWCAGTQKWLASGVGLALLVVSQRVLDQLEPPLPTWLGLNEPARVESGLDASARCWELGWTTPQAIARFETNLTQFERQGWDTITQAVKLRRDYLHERLLEMGWRVVSCPQRWSGILSFEPGPQRAQAIVEDGYRHRIITAKRGSYVRLSPHQFNSMGSLAKTVDWLWHCKVNLTQLSKTHEIPNSPTLIANGGAA